MLADDPALTVRLAGFSGPQPIPVVVAGARTLPADSAVFDRESIVFSAAPSDLQSEVIVLPGPGGVDLEKALVMLGERGILDVLVEGGPSLARSLLESGLVQRGVFYYGSKLAGGGGLAPIGGAFDTLDDAIELQMVDVRRVGADLRVEFEIGGPV